MSNPPVIPVVLPSPSSSYYAKLKGDLVNTGEHRKHENHNPESPKTRLTNTNLLQSQPGNSIKTTASFTAPQTSSKQNANVTIQANGKVPGSSHRNKVPKGVRRARRENAVLEALYAPKDTRVKLIDSNMLAKMKDDTSFGNSACLTKRSGQVKIFEHRPTRSSAEVNKEEKDLNSQDHFPSLDDIGKVLPENWLYDVEAVPPTTANRKLKRNKKMPSKNPILLNLEDAINSQVNSESILDPVETKKFYKPSKLGMKTPLSKIDDTKFRVNGNLLDSSGITYIHRGKIRDKPKRKHVTKLKRAILACRAHRKATFGKHFSTGSKAIKTENETPPPLESNESQVGRMEPESSLDLMPQTITDEIEITSTPLLTTTSTNCNIFKQLFEDALLAATCTEKESKEMTAMVKDQLHSRKFRPYCDMYTSKKIHSLVSKILKDLNRFQGRLFYTDPIKYKTTRRFVHGVKDVLLYAERNKVQLFILAPDIEASEAKGSLDEKIDDILSFARKSNVPYVFSGRRHILGLPIKVKNPVSAIGILNKQGTEPLIADLIEAAEELRLAYNKDFEAKLEEVMKQLNSSKKHEG